LHNDDERKSTTPCNPLTDQIVPAALD